MKIETKKEYTCEACGETYNMAWSDEEAIEEANAIWGNELGDNPAIICDDCFKRGMNNLTGDNL